MRSIPLMRLPHARDLPLPAYATAGSAGMDLLAAVAAPVRLEAGAWARIPTGIALALPVGVEAQIRPRSGLAFRHGVTVLNSPGTVDADYRGEVAVLLVNHGREPFLVRRGERIAQLVLAAYVSGRWQEQEMLPQTPRGAGGFGSTGKEG